MLSSRKPKANDKKDDKVLHSKKEDKSTSKNKNTENIISETKKKSVKKESNNTPLSARSVSSKINNTVEKKIVEKNVGMQKSQRVNKETEVKNVNLKKSFNHMFPVTTETNLKKEKVDGSIKIKKPINKSNVLMKTNKVLLQEKTNTNIRQTNVTINSPKLKHKNLDEKEKLKNDRDSINIQKPNIINDVQKRQQNLDKTINNHKRFQTRTLSPDEVKVLDKSILLNSKNVLNNNDTKNLDIPISNSLLKINQPETFFIPLNDEPSNSNNPKTEASEYDSYEDDFESYESDFESYKSSGSDKKEDSDNNLSSSQLNSTESLCSTTEEKKRKIYEEKKFDSGNFELGDSSKSSDLRCENTLQKIIEIEKYDSNINNILQHSSLTDEGFDENSAFSSATYVNNSISNKEFAQDNKGNENLKIHNNSKYDNHRYKELKNLITLDEMHYSLFEMYPMNYDTFIMIYGKSNSNQIHCQTNDDNIDKNIQTDLLITNNKWTQIPIAYSEYSTYIPNQKATKDYNEGTVSYNNENMKKTKTENLEFLKLSPLEAFINHRNGSGSDNLILQYDIEKKKTLFCQQNVVTISKFISKTGTLLLNYLNDIQNQKEEKKPTYKQNSFTISNKILYDFIKNRPIEKVLNICENIFFTLHPKEKILKEEVEDEMSLKTLVCLWTLYQNNLEPKMLLITSDNITCTALKGGTKGLVAAGLDDGNICVWDLREDTMWHRDTNTFWKSGLKTINNYEELVFRKSCFHSNFSNKDTGNEQWGPVVDILFLELSGKGDLKNNDFSNDIYDVYNTQICVLQNYGFLTIWTVIKKANEYYNTKAKNYDISNCCWSKILLMKSRIVDLNNLINTHSKLQYNKTTDKYYDSKKYSKPSTDSLDMKKYINENVLYKYSEKKGIIRAFSDDDSAAHIFDMEIEDNKPERQKNMCMNDDNFNNWENLIICSKINYFPFMNSLLILYNGQYIINYSMSEIKLNYSIFSCGDNGSHLSNIEVCPLNLPYFIVSCSSEKVHMFSVNSRRPIKNFVVDEKELKLHKNIQFLNMPDFQNVSLVTYLCMNLQFNPSTVENLGGTNRIFWMQNNPHIFITLSNSGKIIVWDLFHSDIFPKFCYTDIERKKVLDSKTQSVNKIINLGTMRGKKLKATIFMLQFEDGDVNFYHLEEKFFKCDLQDPNKSNNLLKAYFERL